MESFINLRNADEDTLKQSRKTDNKLLSNYTFCLSAILKCIK